MSEQNGKSEQGKRFIASRVLVGTNGTPFHVPLMAFDTLEGAQEFAQGEGEWLAGIPEPFRNFLGRLGVTSVGMAIMALQTPDGVRRIEIAPPGAMPKIILKS